MSMMLSPSAYCSIGQREQLSLGWPYPLTADINSLARNQARFRASANPIISFQDDD
jgi:hypothetical protein